MKICFTKNKTKQNKTKQKDQKEKKVSKGESQTQDHWRLKWMHYLMCHDS